MSLNLDALLETLRRRPNPALDGLEPRVWTRIAKLRRTAASVGAWGWRAALVAGLAVAGAFTGSISLAEHKSDFEPFSIRAGLAPSTLLKSGV